MGTRIFLLFVLLAALAAPAATSEAAAPPRQAVVFVGGLGSDADGDIANFDALGGDLLHRGYDVRVFLYGPGGACESGAQSSADFTAYLRGLEPSYPDGVTLVGHSNGGVLALTAPVNAPDLLPFVRRVVTVDAPLLGITRADADVYHVVYGACQAADQLANLYDVPDVAGMVAGEITWLQSQGVSVAAVQNPDDLAVRSSMQQVPLPGVNVLVAASDSGLNHGAIFKTAAGRAALLPIVLG